MYDVFYMLALWTNAALELLQVLSLEPKNAKALFRRGRALHLSRDLSSAKASLEAAKLLLPSDKAIASELASLLAKIKAQKDKEKAAFAKMFA